MFKEYVKNRKLFTKLLKKTKNLTDEQVSKVRGLIPLAAINPQKAYDELVALIG